MIATILISLALLAIVGNIIFRMIRKWRPDNPYPGGGSCRAGVARFRLPPEAAIRTNGSLVSPPEIGTVNLNAGNP